MASEEVDFKSPEYICDKKKICDLEIYNKREATAWMTNNQPTDGDDTTDNADYINVVN